jgi:Putative restriction endonuclease
MFLLDEAGFISAPGVEIRIDPELRPKPDVIATRDKRPTGDYPTEPLDVVCEIASEQSDHEHVNRKCRKYEEWGFKHVYVFISRTDLPMNGGAGTSKRQLRLRACRRTQSGLHSVVHGRLASGSLLPPSSLYTFHWTALIRLMTKK